MYYAIIDTEGYYEKGVQFAYAIVDKQGELIEFHYCEDVTIDMMAIHEQFLRDCKKFSVAIVYGYNISHDESVLNEAIKEDSNGWLRNWFPDHLCTADLLKWTRDILHDNDDFRNWIRSDPRRSRFGTMVFENVYTYITKNHDYKQTHNAMRDVLDAIELFKWLQKH